MGSNSWRLVIYGYEPGTPWWSMVDEIREAVRVGAGMGEERRLQPERIDRALHTAAVFASFCRASDIDEVEAVATSAIRDAVNSDHLLAAIRAQTGLDPRVISGTEEARYGYLAIVNSTTIEDGFGLDIGGGSIQGLAIEGRRLVNAQSLPLGSVNVSERFLPGEKAPAKAMKALRKEVTGQLEEFGWWEGGGRIVGIGGTIRNLAAAAMRRADLPRLDVQGFELERAALDDLIEVLASSPASKRGDVSGIKPDRGDVILGGALVVAAALDAGGFDRIEVTEAGMREGVFFERLLGGPALFEDVRSAVGREPRPPLQRRYRPRGARGAAVARDVRRARLRGPARSRGRRARAAVGRMHAARHRHGDRLRGPSSPLQLPDPEHRPARVQRARADAGRAGHPLPPQGRPGRVAAARPRAQGRR